MVEFVLKQIVIPTEQLHKQWKYIIVAKYSLYRNTNDDQAVPDRNNEV